MKKTVNDFPAVLDAYYARLYVLTRDELRYTLCVDPIEVHWGDFPGETFRVLKEKEIMQYGEYRTRSLVLVSWEWNFSANKINKRDSVKK